MNYMKNARKLYDEEVDLDSIPVTRAPLPQEENEKFPWVDGKEFNERFGDTVKTAVKYGIASLAYEALFKASSYAKKEDVPTKGDVYEQQKAGINIIDSLLAVANSEKIRLNQEILRL